MKTPVSFKSKPNNNTAEHRYVYRVASLALLLVFTGLIFGSCHPSTPQSPATSTATITNSSTLTPVPVGVTYYVDSEMGIDDNTCITAQNPSTPKKTVSGVLSCDPGPGETIRFRGEFKETIYPTRSGTVLYEVQNIAEVKGSVVTFDQAIVNVQPGTDYITIYGSRRGNSGAFAMRAVSGNQVTVDTSDLPGGQFITETDTDPGTLQAAILRPIHFTAWDENDPPVWSGLYQTYHAINQRVIMVSHLKSIAGSAVNPGFPVWPAFEIDGSENGNSDFQILDHLEVVNAESAIAIEANEFQSNYDIIQFNTLHDIGTSNNGSDEIIYFGSVNHPNIHHDYVQIVYNKIGPHNVNANLGDGLDLKPNARNATVFGNEIIGIQPAGCDDAPIKVASTNAFIANNYLHDIVPQSSPGCGISIVDGDGAILVNNIIANVKGVGMRVLDSDNVQILNNTLYNILPEPNCDSNCMELNMGIGIINWQGSTENIVIKNNIVQSAYIGIGRYIWAKDYPYSIDSDYNLVFDADFPFRGTIKKNTHDLVTDPVFANPQNNDFSLTNVSPAIDSGIELTSIFNIDNNLTSAPIIRTQTWDRGACEYK